MHRNYLIIAILFSVLSLFSLSGETQGKYIFDTLTLDDGLSNLSVSSIQQDSRGFLWFGTQSGLNRFDGYEFQVYNHDPFNLNSLPHGLVQTLFIDDENIIWIGTYNGISRFDPSINKFTNYEYDHEIGDSISNNVVTAIAKDDTGNIWIGTLAGLNKLDPETGGFSRYMADDTDSDSLMNDIVRSLLVDSKGRIWIGSLGGIDLYREAGDDFFHLTLPDNGENILPSPYVMKIIEGKDNHLLIGTWDGGLTRLNIDTGKCENFSFPDNRIYTMEIDSEGYLWLGSWGGGLFVFNQNDSTYTHLLSDVGNSSSISSNNIYALFRDSSDIIWVGTNGGGIDKLNFQKQNYQYLVHSSESDSSIDSGKIDALFEDRSGLIWIGIYNGGLNQYNPSTGVIKHYKHDKDDSSTISNDMISGIIEDRRGDLWVSTNSGMNKYISETDSFERIYLNPIEEGENAIYNYFIEDNSGIFWIGAYYLGLVKYDPGTGEVISYQSVIDDPETISDNLVNYVIERDNGEIWVGTNKGLNRFDRNTGIFTRYLLDRNNSKGINNNSVRVLLEDREGRLWVGTGGGGVNLYNDFTDSFTHLTTKDGLSNNFIMAMEEGVGEIWVGTKYGISIIDKASMDIDILNEEDGISTMEFSSGSMVGKDQSVYLGSVNEIARFGIKNIVVNEAVPPVHLDSIEAGGELIQDFSPYLPREEIVLDYEDAYYLYFNYVALNYLSPHNTTYSYKLEGFDSDWIDAGFRRYALYTNIQPGRYLFKIRAANNDGILNESGHSQVLRIKPPLWRTWWAYIIYIFIVLGLILMSSSLVLNRMRKIKLIELEKARNELEVLNRKNELLSIKDPLTDIYNRRFFEESFEKEFARSQRGGSNIAIIMIDIDFFKLFNDTYGHQSGDSCLISVTGSIKASLHRPNDILARYGGEEFCIILPDVTSQGAGQIGKKILTDVESLRIPHSGSSFGYVTISIGIISKIPGFDESSEKLLRLADRALYTAKKNGRNRLEFGTADD